MQLRMFNKKTQGLPLSVVVIAVIALMILIVLITIFSGRMGGFKKPVIAIVAGRFTSELPQGTVLGHAGAIVSRGRGGYVSKVKALKKAGVMIAESLDEIPHLLRRALRGKIRV